MSKSHPSNMYLYKDHPKSCAPDDFWGQVKRTVNGKPVGEDQIQLIVDAILSGLDVRANDVLLDLCCGNGALSDRIFAQCQGGLGVDFSQPLIDVAEKNFQRIPDRLYRLSDAAEYVTSASDNNRFTKALCYGAFQYLTAAQATVVLDSFYRRFPNITTVFIGNLPDKEKINVFFNGEPPPGVANDPGAPIGIWRTESEFSKLAKQNGWTARFARMPKDFYAATYRYDAILERDS